ncbi:hypothetical protein AAG906_019683 [Vitis piasezkii]
MTRYLTMVEDHLKELDKGVIRQVLQNENVKADALAGIAVTLPIKEVVMLPIYLKATPLITPRPMCNTSEANSYWMHDTVKYLKTRELPKDGKQAHRLCIQVAHFTLIKDQLYKRSFGGPYLNCLSELETKYVLANSMKAYRQLFSE